MVQDIVRADSYADEILQLTKQVDKNENVIAQQDTIIKIYRNKVTNYEKTISNLDDIKLEQEVQILNLTKENTKVKKKYSWAKSVAAMLLVGLVVNHYSWKGGAGL